MTIPATQRKAGPFTGNGVQTAWPFAFKTFDTSDVEVTVNVGGVDTLLTLDVHYSVALNENQVTSPGGTVTYPLTGTPLADGSYLAIVSAIEYDQPLDLPGGGDFAPEALENELDRIVMQMQQLDEELGRSLVQSPNTPTGTDLVLPPPQAFSVIGWNADGTALTLYDLSALVVNETVPNWAYSTFTGNGSTTSFVLAHDPQDVANMDVSVDGVTFVPVTDYVLSGSTLVFGVAPPSGAQILARYGSAPSGSGGGGGGGGTPTVGVSTTSQVLTATEGQTYFTLTGTYTVGNGSLAVYRNGQRMELTTDYSETDSTHITFVSGLNDGDRVLCISGVDITSGLPSLEALGLGNVDNTADTAKPVSTAQQAALDLKANKSDVRERLTAARTYYVRTDGSDSNNGLADTAAGAFLTIQKAIDNLITLDFATFNVTIQVADGTYTGANTLKPYVSGGGLAIIRGNTTTPANVLINVSSGNCFFASSAGVWRVTGVKMQTTTTGRAVYALGTSQVDVQIVEFGACANEHVLASGGALVRLLSSYVVSGGSPGHLNATSRSAISAASITCTLTGTPAFTTFAACDMNSLVIAQAITYSGSATGQRYNASANGVVQTYGGGSTYLPGNSAGATSTGGQYL